MSLFDEINRGTQLPEPRVPAQFVSIDSSSDDDDQTSSLKVINRICKPKNPHLYTFDPQDYINEGSTNDFLDCNEITSSILEANGGDSHTNKAIEQHWRTQVKKNQAQKSNNANNNSVSIDQPGETSRNKLYKNNPLMRNLLDKRIAELQVPSIASSKLNDGKPSIESNLQINTAMLTANPDEPDVFFLRDTSKMTELRDDGFRFKHRGTKKTTTPRQYLIYEISDDDFIFTKKVLG